MSLPARERTRPPKRAIAAGLACVLLAFTGVVEARPTSAASLRGEEGESIDSEPNEFAADADADTYAGPAPLTVHFTARAINGAGGVTYSWTFDDGFRSAEQNPVHTFHKRGWYLVSMDARDSEGKTDRITLQVHAWRPRDWVEFQTSRDMRIPEHAVRELERKRRKASGATAVP